MDVPAPDLPDARIVIIGGGVVGASILWHLARAGETDTLLIEKHELTAGSTWHAAGNVPTFSNTWLGQRAGNYAWRLYSELAADPEDPITYRKTNAFWPAHTRDRFDHFHHVLGISAGLGFDLQLVSVADMEAMHPFWQDDGSVRAGLLDPYEGDIDPSQLTQSFARRARSLGARVARHTRVVAIEPGSAGRWLVRAAGPEGERDVACDIVINAAGFYANEVSHMVGVATPLAVVEHQYLVTGPVDELAGLDPFPLVRDPELMFYLRQEQDALLFGNYGHPGRTVWEAGLPAEFNASLFPPSTADIAETAARAAVHVPILEEAGVARFVNGPIAYAPDAQPLCGPVEGVEGFYQATGFQIGVTQAAAAGKVLTEMITGGDTEWDVWPWDPRRFGPWATPDFTHARVRELYEHQYAEPFPHRIWQDGRPTQRSQLYSTLAEKGANFGEIGGWERAFWFSDGHRYSHDTLSYRDEAWHDTVAAECQAVRDRVGVMNHDGFSRFEVSGPGAADFIEMMFTGRAPAAGRVRLSYLLRPDGMLWSEATISHLDDGRFLLLGPTAARHRDFDWLARHLPGDGSVRLRYGVDKTSTLMVMGPNSRELLSRLTTHDLSKEAASWMSVRTNAIAGVDVLGLRVSFVGELGWELHVDADHLLTLYNALWEAGVDLGLVDFGSYALNAMRIEKSYLGWQTDFGTEYTPFDCGLGSFVDFTKPGFVGRAAALERSRQPPEWTFATFTISEPTGADPAPSAPIRLNGETVGYVTSASPGFRTDTRLALGYLTASAADASDGFTIDILGGDRQAQRERQAAYDPGHHRPRS